MANISIFTIEGERSNGIAYLAKIITTPIGTVCRVDGKNYYLKGDSRELLRYKEIDFARLESHDSSKAVATFNSKRLGKLRMTFNFVKPRDYISYADAERLRKSL